MNQQKDVNIQKRSLTIIHALAYYLRLPIIEERKRLKLFHETEKIAYHLTPSLEYCDRVLSA